MLTCGFHAEFFLLKLDFPVETKNREEKVKHGHVEHILHEKRVYRYIVKAE